MATNYIVWDKVEKRIVSGPHASSADAQAAQKRHAQKASGGNVLGKQAANLSVETVTV